MKGMLVRIGLESTNGGIYSPAFKDGNYEYIPIPDEIQLYNFNLNKKQINLIEQNIALPYYSKLPGLTRDYIIDFLPKDKLKLSNKNKTIYLSPVEKTIAHYDPHFALKTFGDYWKVREKGRIPKKFKNYYLNGEDIHIFFVGTFWDTTYEWYEQNGRLSFSEMIRIQKNKTKICIFGYFLVEKIIEINEFGGWENLEKVIDVYPEYHDAIIYNFHHIRYDIQRILNFDREYLEKDTIIIIGDKKCSGLLNRYITLKDVGNKVTEIGKICNISERDAVRFKSLNEKQIEAILNEIE